MEDKEVKKGSYGAFNSWISWKPGLAKLHFDPSLTFKSDGTVTRLQSLKIKNWDAELKARISTTDREPVWLEEQEAVEKISGDSGCGGSGSTGLQWKLWQVEQCVVLVNIAFVVLRWLWITAACISHAFPKHPELQLLHKNVSIIIKKVHVLILNSTALSSFKGGLPLSLLLCYLAS